MLFFFDYNVSKTKRVHYYNLFKVHAQGASEKLHKV